MENNEYVAAFDPGIKNLCFLVEKIDVSDPVNKSETVFFVNSDISSETELELYIKINDLLDSHKHILNKCSYILIEQQMAFGNNLNLKTVRIAQHIFSYFSIYYRDFKHILNYPAFHKTRVFSADKMNKPQRKKWAINKATSIWTSRRDGDTLAKLEGSPKKDDICDCLLMALSYALKFNK